ncbi:MAG: hypothetical protein ACO3AE_04995, partial [Robiginitalea sp.]
NRRRNPENRYFPKHSSGLKVSSPPDFHLTNVNKGASAFQAVITKGHPPFFWGSVLPTTETGFTCLYNADIFKCPLPAFSNHAIYTHVNFTFDNILI